MKKYFLCFLFFSSALSFSLMAQDVHFSQYNFTPMLINPAQAGAYRNLEVIANYKTQWASIDPGHQYKTMMFTFDGRLMQKKWKTKWLSTGINIYNDKAGDGRMSTTATTAAFGYHTMLDARSTLSGCLFGGYAQRKIDYSRLLWDQQYDPGTGTPILSNGESLSNNQFGYPDVGMGVLYQYTKGQMYSSSKSSTLIIHAGLAYSHILRPKYSYYGSPDEKLYQKVTGHVDVLIGIKGTRYALLPGVIYMKQGPSSEIFPGCFFRYLLKEQSRFTGYVKGASIMFGTHFRANPKNSDSFIPSIQLEVAEYAIGISYDVNVSGLTTATSGRGGFEISLRYGNPNPFVFRSAASFQ